MSTLWEFNPEIGVPIDTTDDLGGTITAQGENGSMEGKENAFDNQQNTKWLDFSPKGSWIQYAYAAGWAGRLTGYTITSANDCPERDPADWQLLGSNDGGANWTTVDNQTGVAFNARFQKLEFTVSGMPTYKIYRLNVTKVFDLSSANSVQLSEIELVGKQVYEYAQTSDPSRPQYLDKQYIDWMSKTGI